MKSKIKTLFLIHDLGVGGAEKVLVNLVNHLDVTKFDVTVIALFGGGVNEKMLRKEVRYRSIFPRNFPGNSHVMKLFSPRMLHKMFIREKFDIEISYLEGPSARIISGCPHPDTKLVSWIHIEQHTRKIASGAFRNYKESCRCHERYDRTVCVSEFVKYDFANIYPAVGNLEVLYNTNETGLIIRQQTESVEDELFLADEFKICFVGKISKRKGIDRIARLHARLRWEGFPVHFYILGVGPEREAVEKEMRELGLESSFSFLGYQTNPYKYIARCDLFVCASLSEGFSTAATEALIVGTPVVTMEVSGMREMLGENNEYGIITEQNEDALYLAVKKLLEDSALLVHYKQKAIERGRNFSTANTVKAVENMLESLVNSGDKECHMSQLIH